MIGHRLHLSFFEDGSVGRLPKRSDAFRLSDLSQCKVYAKHMKIGRWAAGREFSKKLPNDRTESPVILSTRCPKAVFLSGFTSENSDCADTRKKSTRIHQKKPNFGVASRGGRTPKGGPGKGRGPFDPVDTE